MIMGFCVDLQNFPMIMCHAGSTGVMGCLLDGSLP